MSKLLDPATFSGRNKEYNLGTRKGRALAYYEAITGLQAMSVSKPDELQTLKNMIQNPDTHPVLIAPANTESEKYKDWRGNNVKGNVYRPIISFDGKNLEYLALEDLKNPVKKISVQDALDNMDHIIVSDPEGSLVREVGRGDHGDCLGIPNSCSGLIQYP